MHSWQGTTNAVCFHGSTLDMSLLVLVLVRDFGILFFDEVFLLIPRHSGRERVNDRVRKAHAEAAPDDNDEHDERHDDPGEREEAKRHEIRLLVAVKRVPYGVVVLMVDLVDPHCACVRNVIFGVVLFDAPMCPTHVAESNMSLGAFVSCAPRTART